jgi:hypothetical protein
MLLLEVMQHSIHAMYTNFYWMVSLWKHMLIRIVWGVLPYTTNSSVCLRLLE